MGLGVIVGSEKDMYLGRALVEVGWIDVEDLAPRQWLHIARGSGTQEVEVTIVRDGVERLSSRNASRRIGRGEKSHSIAYWAKFHFLDKLIRILDAG